MYTSSRVDLMRTKVTIETQTKRTLVLLKFCGDSLHLDSNLVTAVNHLIQLSIISSSSQSADITGNRVNTACTSQSCLILSTGRFGIC